MSLIAVVNSHFPLSSVVFGKSSYYKEDCVTLSSILGHHCARLVLLLTPYMTKVQS